MTTLRSPYVSTAEQTQPRAVLCGSFRRDVGRLKQTFAALAQVATVLSPVSVDFASDWDGFVYTDDEAASTPREIEDRHLQALADADFVWLFAPGGYVGESARTELAFARLAGIPVYTSDVDLDIGLLQWVLIVDSPAAVISALEPPLAPAQGLRRLQHYYRLRAQERGWANESPQDTMLLLTEEVGELARAVRQRVHLQRDGRPTLSSAAEEEVADVLLLALHLATALGIDAATAVVHKEAVNQQRVDLRPAS